MYITEKNLRVADTIVKTLNKRRMYHIRDKNNS